MRWLVVFFVLFVTSFGGAGAYRPSFASVNRFNILEVGSSTSRQIKSRLSVAEATPSTSSDGAFQKHECTSCAYVYDEEKGFKKRYPPGTKWASLKTFACPVCGAAKDKFIPVTDK